MANKYLTQGAENYIYIYHLSDDGDVILLPNEPESMSDNMQSTFQNSNPIARSAPTYSWTGAGPRTISFTFEFRRDMMDVINAKGNGGAFSILNMDKDTELSDEDYTDMAIKKLQACALPRYSDAKKMINPPMVAVKIRDELFIKGIVNGGVNVTYKKPLLYIDGKDRYANVTIGFSVTEVDPYSADTVATMGSFRGISRTLNSRIYKEGS